MSNKRSYKPTFIETISVFGAVPCFLGKIMPFNQKGIDSCCMFLSPRNCSLSMENADCSVVKAAAAYHRSTSIEKCAAAAAPLKKVCFQKELASFIHIETILAITCVVSRAKVNLFSNQKMNDGRRSLKFTFAPFVPNLSNIVPSFLAAKGMLSPQNRTHNALI